MTIDGAPRIQVIVLAAGAASRFGSDKLIAVVAGRPLLDWTLDAALDAADPRDVLVMVDDLQGDRAALAAARGVQPVLVPDAAEGMARSIASGFAACSDDAAGACIVLADDPLAARALGEVLTVARAGSDVIVAVRREPPVPHPVYLPRARWSAAINALAGDRGLRMLLDDAGSWIDIAEPAQGDVDEPVDLTRLAEALQQIG